MEIIGKSKIERRKFEDEKDIFKSFDLLNFNY